MRGSGSSFKGEPWRPSLLYNACESCPGSWMMYWVVNKGRAITGEKENAILPTRAPNASVCSCYLLLVINFRPEEASHISSFSPGCVEFSLHFCLSGALQYSTWHPISFLCCSCMHIHTDGSHRDWDFHLYSSDGGLYKHTHDCRGCVSYWP